MVRNLRKRRYEPASEDINSKQRKSQPSWQETVAKAQCHRDNSLASADRDVLSAALQRIGKHFKGPPKGHLDLPGEVLQPRDVKITETLPEELVKMLASKQLTATEVTRAFLRRAVVAQTVVSRILRYV